jgi:protein SCO1/2
MRRLRPVAVAAAVLMAAGACGGSSAATHPRRPAADTSLLHGMLPSPAPTKPSFTLVDTNGRPFDFAARTAGKLTYLYYGYTRCPDACPTTMADIAQALRRQPPAVQRQVAVVFVTTDPRRDTRAVLRRWLDRFSTQFIGLTGTQLEIKGAEAATGVPLAQAEKVGTKGDYAVQHSTQVFAYSPDGVAHVFYLDGNSPSDYAEDIPVLLRFR